MSELSGVGRCSVVESKRSLVSRTEGRPGAVGVADAAAGEPCGFSMSTAGLPVFRSSFDHGLWEFPSSSRTRFTTASAVAGDHGASGEEYGLLLMLVVPALLAGGRGEEDGTEAVTLALGLLAVAAAMTASEPPAANKGSTMPCDTDLRFGRIGGPGLEGVVGMDVDVDVDVDVSVDVGAVDG